MSNPMATTVAINGEKPRYSVPIRERLAVWLRNLWNWRTAWAVRHLSKEMQKDPTFRAAWQANIAMPIYDSQNSNVQPPFNLNHADGCNLLADRLMKHLFGA